MKELQEEYLFLNREGINGWEDVFREKQKAEHEISDIDAKKKELYNEHARCKYSYEKDGDAAVYLYHEANYREQLAELKEIRKEAKTKLGTINRCLKESTYAHLEIPDDVDIENLYEMDVPKFEKEPSYNSLYESYKEVLVPDAKNVIEPYEPEVQTEDGISVAESGESMSDYDICEEALIPETVEEHETFGKLELVAQPAEEILQMKAEEKTEIISNERETVSEEYSYSTGPVMTKEIYQSLTDKEKVEWLELADCDLQEAISRFGEKTRAIGIAYKYSDDMLDEFMRLESVSGQMKKEQEQKEEVREEVRILDRNRGMSR